MNQEQVQELLYQALETELGGVQVYTTALRCAINDDLKQEWEEYLEQTENHVEVVREMMEELGLNPETETPGREVVRHIGSSLVQAMEKAQGAGNPEDRTRMSGLISGSATTDLLKTGTGVLELGAAGGNSYAGNTLVTVGTPESFL